MPFGGTINQPYPYLSFSLHPKPVLPNAKVLYFLTINHLYLTASERSVCSVPCVCEVEITSFKQSNQQSHKM